MSLQLALAQSQWRQVEELRFDWDTHKGVRLVVEIPEGWNDPGDFTRIRVNVPGQKEFVTVNKLGWVRYDSDEASTSPLVRETRNALKSANVLAVNMAEGRTVLFLFGYSYASSPGSLDILELADSGVPRVVLHREELGVKQLLDVDGDGVVEIVGYPCLSEEFGNGLLTYDPFNVYKLPASGDRATLSLPLSKSYNLKHYYGWAGPKCRDDVAVVLHPPNGGKPLVMKTLEAKKLTEAKP